MTEPLSEEPLSDETLSDEKLWSWVDRDAAELAAHLAAHPEDRPRVESLRRQIESVREVTAEVRLPEWIGPYRVTGLLGAGGMGVVYAAVQPNPRREVAVKVVRGGPAAGSLALARFEAECEALGRLGHPAVATVHEAGVTAEDQPYLVMERVRGEPVTSWARGRERGEVLALFADVCDGVEAAHAAGIVHRDLKPAHVLVGGDGRPKILDFGLARQLGADHRRTATGAVAGTLPWMSPEQLRGDDSRIGPATDVWALGVLLYELVTGRLPHTTPDTSAPAAIRAICETAPPRPSRVARGVSFDLETVLLHALARDPADRYPSAGALAADVRCVLADQPVSARRPPLRVRLARVARRHRGVLRLAAACLVAGSAATAWALREAVPEPGSLAAAVAAGDVARAPFGRMRFSYAGPEVYCETLEEWCALLAANGVEAGVLAARARARFGAAWERELGPRLLELLAAETPAAPADLVELRVRPLGSAAAVTIEVRSEPAHYAALVARGPEDGAPGEAPQARRSDRATAVDYPRIAPFSAVRWPDGGPVEVEVEGRHWRLARVFGMEVDAVLELVAEVFDPADARRRFAEDLVQAVIRKGYRIDRTIQATLVDPDTGAVVERPRLPLTAANREAVIEAAHRALRARMLAEGTLHPAFAIRASAFTGLRWDGDRPIVRVDGDWHELVAVAGVETAELVDLVRRSFGAELARKRFEEDLFDVLFAAGHEVAERADLVLCEPVTGARLELAGVPVTTERRQALMRYLREARGR